MSYRPVPIGQDPSPLCPEGYMVFPLGVGAGYCASSCPEGFLKEYDPSSNTQACIQTDPLTVLPAPSGGGQIPGLLPQPTEPAPGPQTTPVAPSPAAPQPAAAAAPASSPVVYYVVAAGAAVALSWILFS